MPKHKEKINWPKLEQGKKIVLNIVNSGAALPKTFRSEEWQEIVVSKEIPNAISLDIRELSALPGESCNVIWNAGSLSYLYAHEVVPVLTECYRILQPKGVLLLQVADLQRIGEIMAQGKLENALYNSPAGPIAAIDLLFGHRGSLSAGNKKAQTHTGFAARTIPHKLTPLGFGEVEVTREGWMLRVMARKITASPADKPLIRIREEDLNEKMRIRDTIEKNPEWLKITPEDAFNA